MKIYIAGKVSHLNYAEVEAKFDRAKKMLQNWGYEPISPLDNDCQSSCWCDQMMACLPLLMTCGGIYLLSDWERSEGAKIEHTFAQKRQMYIIHQSNQTIIE